MSAHRDSDFVDAGADTMVRVACGAFGLPFSVLTSDPRVAAGVEFVYGDMLARPALDGLEIEVSPLEGHPGRFAVFFNEELMFEASRLGDILHGLDNHLTVEFELALPGLYFVHGAALADDGRVTLIVGESGAGKSTTAYALAASGMEYFSDELAALEPATAFVHPYPRAICLKRVPPPPLTVPGSHLRTEWTLHVRARDLGASVAQDPLPLARIVFVRYSPENRRVTLRALSRAEAAARLYQGALNPAAHPALGLDDTIHLIRRADCFELLSAGIEETLAVLGRALDVT